MVSNCHIPPDDKRAYISKLGKRLIKDNGKKKYYKPEEIKKAQSQSGLDVDYLCWGMATFSTHKDFDTYHARIGEDCDYSEMKSTMLDGMDTNGETDWFDLPDLDVDRSWLDFGDISESMGDFFSSLFDWVD